jgi:hypothetical protein
MPRIDAGRHGIVCQFRRLQVLTFVAPDIERHPRPFSVGSERLGGEQFPAQGGARCS